MQVTDLELKGHTLVKGTGKGGDALQYVSRHLGFGELISGLQTPPPKSPQIYCCDVGEYHLGSFPISK